MRAGFGGECKGLGPPAGCSGAEMRTSCGVQSALPRYLRTSQIGLRWTGAGMLMRPGYVEQHSRSCRHLPGITSFPLRRGPDGFSSASCEADLPSTNHPRVWSCRSEDVRCRVIGINNSNPGASYRAPAYHGSAAIFRDRKSTSESAALWPHG